MIPTLSWHAKQRMQKRGITRENIEAALSSVFMTTPGEPGTIWHYGWGAPGRQLKVCLTEVEPKKVTTVAWRDDDE